MVKINENTNNINLATVEDCNLLCKLIIDYLDTDKITLTKIIGTGRPEKHFKIKYPAGSFINYRDTSYEVTDVYFFYPSRHSIDGVRYDLEVNIYHGDNGTHGIVAHSQYHEHGITGDLKRHKHFHYDKHHNNDNTGGTNEKTETDKTDTKNIITCLLFNKGKHSGDDVNIFFNQFVHHKKFKNLSTSDTSEAEINTHENLTLDQIYPKKRSFFMYDDSPLRSTSKKDTIVVFDTIQTISKEILDRLYLWGIKETNGDLSLPTKLFGNMINLLNVKYRKNVELITDPAYKKSKRAQIKDLLSLTRMSTYVPSHKTSKEYHIESENIIKSFSGGENSGYLNSESEPKAKRLSKMWEDYGRDYPEEKKFSDINTTDSHPSYKNVILNNDTANQYKYLENFLEIKEVKELIGNEKFKETFNITYIEFKKKFIKEYEKWRKDTDFKNIPWWTNPGYYQISEYLYWDLFKEIIPKTGDTTDLWVDALLKSINAAGFRDYLSIRFFFEDIDKEWQKKNNCDSNFIDSIPINKQITTITKARESYIIAIFHLMKGYGYLKDFKCLVKNETELNRTLSNEECQPWLSNQVHYEGDLWKFWEKPLKISKDEKFEWEDLSIPYRQKIGEGMLEYEETGDKKVTKWKTHNYCRNPGNRSAGPWCYTKNPNKRWEYCNKPNYTNYLGKIVLFFVFIFVIIVAFFTVKTLFSLEYPMKFVASLTGGQISSTETFGNQAGQTTPPKSGGRSGNPKPRMR